MPRYRNITGITLEDYRKDCLTSARPFTVDLCNLSEHAQFASGFVQLEFACTDTEEIEYSIERSDEPMIAEIDVQWEIKLTHSIPNIGSSFHIGTITVNRSTCADTRRETVHTLDADLNMDREIIMEALSQARMEFEDWEYQNEKEFRVKGHWYNGNMYGFGFYHNRRTDYENEHLAFLRLINWVARVITSQINDDFRILQKDLEKFQKVDFFDLETPI